MVAHDFRCSQGHIFEKLVSWDTEEVKCKCGKLAKRVFLPHSQRPENAARFSAVVVFRKSDGSYIFPGRSTEATPKGCQRVELRNANEVRRFEREENRRLKDIHQASMERRGARYEAEKRERRAELSMMLGKMSPRARQFAEFAMGQSDARQSHSSKAARFDAGFRVEVFSNDKSNRSEFRDSDTNWKSRRD